MSKSQKILVVLLFLICLFFRLYRLSSVPPSPSLDEVSLGYNAYSILRTGMDEFGIKFPLLLRAYDDYRPALYVYPVALAIKFLGLNVFAVRIPSVIFSLIGLYFIFQTARLIGKKYIKSESMALWTLGLSSISAWHIYLSRLGHEVNLGLMLFSIGVYGLLYWVIQAKTNALYWGSAFLAFSLYGYQSEKVVVPVFLVLFGLIFWKRLWKKRKETGMAIFLFCLISFAAVVATLSPEGMSRLHGTSAIGADTQEVQEQTANHASAVAHGDKIAAALTSRYVIPIKIIGNNYIRHFAPLWVFNGAQRENHKIPYLGLFYWWEAVLIIIGLWYMYTRVPKDIFALLILWILTGPLPAAITTQAPHAMRAFTMFPPLILFAGFGAYAITTNRFKYFVASLVLVLVICSTYQMSGSYFQTFPREQSDSFEYALGQAIGYVQKHEHIYTHIAFANNGAAYQSYMFYLYYTAFDPSTYLKLGGTKSGGYAQSHTIGKYAFYDISPTMVLVPNTLYITNAANVPPNGKVIKTFTNLDDKVVLVALSL